MSKGGLRREYYLKLDKAVARTSSSTGLVARKDAFLEKMAAKYVGPEDPKILESSKHVRTSRFGMPLGLDKVAQRIQKECFYP